MNRVLKPNHFAFIAGWRQCNKKRTNKNRKRNFRNFAPKIGFKVNEILSSDLSEHSKIFNPSYAQKGKKEHLIIFRKRIMER